ncbi:MAG: acyl-CoA dehydrogenase family protein [Myxococcota bacterium]|jgi:alkylation response protein AidB-like acyl-CoA dehydrogenase|nr:acyl-CoA dehydrogenase [Deltaproteobacteria bacterium]MCP4245246.1 acyl-CoA/acyl-ACP dehydrogenase [bacterium]MDP6073992.1 acyl-CoA dehydrogenase family protein [Myxococcota bacterium]MDP6241823.1 acyl-CoA dehydrogenase family protein [Myxococcota bacterium]MDP7074536.1 acyl-CoA dehydrogenase family protein [Myxococcota bacterium]
MDFGLSEDQLLLEQTLRSFLSDRVPIERVRELRDADCPNDRAIWDSLAELGAAGVLVPEAQGGSGLGLLDAALVSEALGHAVAPTPFLASSVMAPVALGAVSGSEACDWLAGIASGEQVFGVAATELFSVREDAGVSLKAGVLDGKAMLAIDACRADFLLVALDSETFAVVEVAAPGLEITRLRTVDATRCTAEAVFEGVAPKAVFEAAGSAIARMLDAGRIALAADTLGAAESMLEQSVAYAKERKQFERLIGSFQAVKHMCAEMVAELEPARSFLWYAAHSFDAIPTEAPLMACQVLAHISEIAREIASISTQVHGGIGWTDEQNLHFWFKRIGNARHLLGGPESLRERAAELEGFAATA